MTIDELKQLRLNKGLSAAKLAKMCDVSEGTIWNIEYGKSKLKRTTAEKLSKALDIPMPEFENLIVSRSELDLTGMVFGRLKVISKSPSHIKHDRRCSYWLCECECDNKITVAAVDLKRHLVKSCGCWGDERLKNGRATQEKARVFGTNVDLLRSKKLNKNNKSGVKGVCWDKNKKRWLATITFQNRRYYLGQYENIEDAISARKSAEDETHKKFLEWYETEYKKTPDSRN